MHLIIIQLLQTFESDKLTAVMLTVFSPVEAYSVNTDWLPIKLIGFIPLSKLQISLKLVESVLRKVASKPIVVFTRASSDCILTSKATGLAVCGFRWVVTKAVQVLAVHAFRSRRVGGDTQMHSSPRYR